MVLRRLFNPTRNNPSNLPGLQLWNQATGPLSTNGAVNLVAASSQSLSKATAILSASPMTVGGWFNFSSNGIQQYLFNLGGTGGFVLQRFTDNNIYWTLGGSAQINTSGVTGSTGTWYHIIALYDGSNISVYINGSLAAGPTVTTAGSVGSTTAIGASTTGSNFVNGLISQFVAYQTNLSPALITLLYAGGSGLPFELWPSSLLTSLVSVYQFRQPGNLGLASFGSNTLTLNNTPTYVAGKVVGVPSLTGEAVSVVGDSSGNNNAASQTTGGNRYTLQLNQINGLPALNNTVSTTASYLLLSNIPLSGTFSLYVAGFDASPTTDKWEPLGGLSNDGLFNKAAAFAIIGGSTVNAAYTGNSGNILARWRRDAANVIHYMASGMAEVTLGTVAGTLTIAGLFARFNSSEWTSGNNQFAELILSNQDNVTTGGNTQMVAYLQNRYNLTLP